MTCWESCCSHSVRLGICLCIVVVAFLLDVIGFSVPYWYYDGSTQMFEGLWKSCSEVNNVVSCVAWVAAGAPAWFKANQAMQTIGMVFLLVALVCICVLLICKKGDYKVKICAICFLIASAVFILIGVIVYGARSSAVVTSNLSFGFTFVIVAAILAIIAAICFCIGIDNNWEIEAM